MINEGKWDRRIRFIIGILFLVISIFWLQNTLRLVFFVIGIISLITSLTGFCLLYNAFGFNSLQKKK
ncbi:DUF2892 domain-containing protein [Candidatus Woesearchaeota archaeon]|nr:DUF2892 domain-containing protein [Candidatus Woesearchaeota archaeon]